MAITKARDMLGAELAALVGESYDRAYGDMVRVQQLTELEEVISYFQPVTIGAGAFCLPLKGPLGGSVLRLEHPSGRGARGGRGEEQGCDARDVAGAAQGGAEERGGLAGASQCTLTSPTPPPGPAHLDEVCVPRPKVRPLAVIYYLYYYFCSIICRINSINLFTADARQSQDTLVSLLGFNPLSRVQGQPGYGAGSGKPHVMFAFLKHLWATSGNGADTFSRSI